MHKVIYTVLFLTISLLAKEQTIVLGAGCFWGVEKHFSKLNGVKDVEVGYAGGEYANPNYKTVLRHRRDNSIKNHAEVVKVVYDDETISTEDILKTFWEMHDPTQGNRQGNDVGNNYRSIILYTTPKQKELAYETKARFQKLLQEHGYGKITTEIKPLRKFYRAEEYHQDYLEKNPFGYCPNHSTGVTFEEQRIKGSSSAVEKKDEKRFYKGVDKLPLKEKL